MALAPSNPGPELLAFLSGRHVATLTTLRPDGTPHVGKDPRAPRPSQARAGTLQGGHTAVVRDDAAAVARYAVRYRQPPENPALVAIEIAVDRILGSA